MEKGLIVGLIIAVILIGGGFSIFSGEKTTAPTTTETPTPTPTATLPSTTGQHQVIIENFKFSPASLTIKAGDTVTWINKDSAPHTATADDKSFDSDRLETDDSFSFTFTSVGTNPYFCNIHPSMKGSVTVQ